MSYNVNGIRAALNKGFINCLKTTNPDVICIQETKANPRQLTPEQRHPLDYKSYWNSAEKKGYSGTSIFSLKEPEKIETKIKLQRFDDEGRMVLIKFDDFTLVNFYITNGARDQKDMVFKLEQYNHIFKFLKKLEKKEEKLIVLGDFNIAHTELDLERPKQNVKNTMFTPEERNKIDEMISSGFTDSFRKFHKEGENYTWWPYFANARERNLGWRIDYIFTKNIKLKDAFILPKVMGSDHCPIGIEL